MGILTLILLILLSYVVFCTVLIFKRKTMENTKTGEWLSYIKSIGLFGLVIGIFGQLIGLYQAFSAIQEMGDVAPAMLAGGLRVSMISTIYGFTIFIIAYILWFALVSLKQSYDKKE